MYVLLLFGLIEPLFRVSDLICTFIAASQMKRLIASLRHRKDILLPEGYLVQGWGRKAEAEKYK
jgi:hypothetical protein